MKYLLSLIACIAIVVGCQTPPATVAYKGESAANVTVIAAMTAWGAYVASEHPGIPAELKVKSAFEKTQSAELALIDATTAWVASKPADGGATAPPNVLAAQAAFQTAVNELVALVKAFGIDK